MPSENEVGVTPNINEQTARAKLREGFLRAVSELNGQQCSLLTYEHSTLQGVFTAWKSDGSEIIVNNLETPARIKMPSAVLRTSDLLAVHFEPMSK